MTTLREQLEGRHGDPKELFREPQPGEARFAPGEAATASVGVQYQGPFETVADGTCRAVRLHAMALHRAGLPVLLQSFSRTMVDDSGVVITVHRNRQYEEILGEVGEIVDTSVAALPIRIKHLVIRDAQHLDNVCVPRSLYREERMMDLIDQILKTTIVYSVWERTEIDPRIARFLSRVGECWVPCEQNKELLQRSGVENVVVVPHPIAKDAPLPLPGIWAPLSGMVLASRRYYSIGAWQPRKGYHELIGAFLRAFEPGLEASLVLKTTGASIPGYPTIAESVKGWLQDRLVLSRGWTTTNVAKNLGILNRKLSQKEILQLHHTNNIYVSSSHGEAFCLPAFDAKLAGNRMVHVPFGGTLDFEEEDDVRVLHTMGPVHPFYKWEGKWAEFSVAGLSEALLRAEPSSTCERGAHLQRFESENVGRLMKERVLGLAREHAPAAFAVWKQEGRC